MLLIACFPYKLVVLIAESQVIKMSAIVYGMMSGIYRQYTQHDITLFQCCQIMYGKFSSVAAALYKIHIDYQSCELV